MLGVVDCYAHSHVDIASIGQYRAGGQPQGQWRSHKNWTDSEDLIDFVAIIPLRGQEFPDLRDQIVNRVANLLGLFLLLASFQCQLECFTNSFGVSRRRQMRIH